MRGPSLAQLIAAAVAEAQRPLIAELDELRAGMVAVCRELGELRLSATRPYRIRLRHRERRRAVTRLNDQPPATPPVHASGSDAECRASDMSVQSQVTRETGPGATEIAKVVVGALPPAVRAEFITAGNAEAVTGQDWRWVLAEARRLGVPIGGTGKKRVVDIATFRAALAKDAAESKDRKPEASDPLDALRRRLGYTLRADGHA